MSNETAAQVAALKAFFEQQQFPKSVVIGPAETITDIPKFLDSHFHMIESYDDPKKFDVFLLRLIKLKEKLSQAAQ